MARGRQDLGLEMSGLRKQGLSLSTVWPLASHLLVFQDLVHG